MESKVINVDLAGEIFDVDVRPHLLHQVVVMQLNNRRAGTASTKTKGLVRGGGKKPWKQKGTGRARAGSVRSPLWAGGGTIFGPSPREYGYRMPKKARRQALLSALSLRKKENKLIVVEDIVCPEIKTRQMVELMASLEVKRALVVIPLEDRNLELSSRNLSNVKVIRVAGLNVYDLLRFEHLILTKGALTKTVERLSQ